MFRFWLGHEDNLFEYQQMALSPETVEEIAACEMRPDPDDLEFALLKTIEDTTEVRGNTIIAFCLS